MKKWLAVAGMLLAGVLSGCQGLNGVASNRFADNEAEREQVTSMPPMTDTQVRLSGEFVSEYFSASDSPSLAGFDLFCQTKMGRRCTDASRATVQDRLPEARANVKAKIEAKKAAHEKWLRDIASGERRIRSLEEARMYYQPSPGDRLTSRPAISGGDGEYYILQAYITAKHGDSYIFWWADSPIVQHGTYGMPAMGAIFDSPAFIDEDIGFNSHVSVVGRYVDNQTIPLTNGGSATVPVFDDAYIFHWQRH